MARSFRRRSFQRSPRRRINWSGNEIATTVEQSAPAAGTILYQNLDFRTAANGFLIGGTVVRIRGYLNIFSDVTSPTVNTLESPFGAVGIAIVDGEAFDAGVASLPTPYTEAGDTQWMFHSYWSANTGNFGAGSGWSVPFRLTIDNKSMRKITSSDVMVWFIQNQSATDAALFTWATRVLIKLP